MQTRVVALRELNHWIMIRGNLTIYRAISVKCTSEIPRVAVVLAVVPRFKVLSQPYPARIRPMLARIGRALTCVVARHLLCRNPRRGLPSNGHMGVKSGLAAYGNRPPITNCNLVDRG